MKYSPIKDFLRFLGFIFFALTLILACSKDDDETYDTVDAAVASDSDEKKATNLTAKTTETRTVSFSPIEDAYVQSGKGYNQKIVRLEDGRRKSYLMFDLRKIEPNEGSFISIDLEFTISSDGGNGTVSIFQGKAGSWSEDKLSASSAPATDALLAKTTDDYKVGQTKRINLDSNQLTAGIITLVMTHQDGNDLAFASKEHPDENGPKLVVSYKASQDASTDEDDENDGQESQDSSNNPIEAAIYAPVPSDTKAPMAVDFKAWNSKNQNEIVSYFWDFMDGASTTTKNPSHTYTKPGIYEVQLTVKNAEGFTHSTTEKITVTGSSTNSSGNSSGTGGSNSGGNTNNPVEAAIYAPVPSNTKAPVTIGFKAWNSKNQNEIVSYFWDFKDGATATKKNPSHTYTKPGVYNVQLTVKNAEGFTHSTTEKITVTGSSTNSGSSSGGSSSGGSSSGGSSSGGSSSGSSNSGNYPSNAVFASDFGFRSGDATTAFKAAINSGSSYVVIDKQSSDWVIQPTRFFDLRNMTIVFEPGVTVRAKSGAFGSDGARMFQLTRASNVTIEGSGATFRMNKSEYSSGEQRHALDISQSNGVTVRGLTIRESGGDGVHIAGDGNSDYSQNITLENIKSLNNKRDGICIVSAQDVWVRNSEFSQSSGKKPEAGVTIEADKPTERLVNINFIGCKFSGNDSAGFHFSTTRMNGGSRPISVKVVDCEFSNNLVSPTNTTAEVYIGGGLTNNPVDGEIRFERVKFNGSRNRIIFTRKSSKGFKAVFKDCDASNVVSSASNSPIRLEAHGNRNTLGGIQFDNFDIQYNRDVPFMTINAPSNGGTFTVKDVTGSFDIQEPNDNSLKYSGGYRSHQNVNVSIDYDHN